MPVTVSDLRRYPVKSCRGESVAEALVEPWGLEGDRRWVLVDPVGAAVTAREVNRLVLVTPTLAGDGLRMSAPGRPDLEVPRPPTATEDPARQRPVRLWGSEVTAADAGDDAAAWVSDVADRTLRLLWLDDPTRRATDPRFSTDEDRVSFADGYPLLLTSEDSLAALADDALATAGPAGGHPEPLSMTRFRPNLVVRGAAAWAEDDWRRIRVGGPGGVTFRLVKGCARCVMTTVDPETAERGKEPLRTLARTRRWDRQTWFGMNLVPDLPVDAGAVLRVDDEVEVLEAVEPGDGPPRAPR